MTVRFLRDLPSAPAKGTPPLLNYTPYASHKPSYLRLWSTHGIQVTNQIFFHSRLRRQLQGRLQSLPPARLHAASQNESGPRRVSAGQRIRPAVHVRHRHANLSELLRSELQNLPRDPTETPEPQIQFQLQGGEPVPQRRSGSMSSAVRAAGCRRCHVETLVDQMDDRPHACYLFCDVIHAICVYSLSDPEWLELLSNNVIQHLAHFAFNARERTSTDLRETEVFELFKMQSSLGFQRYGL